MGEYEPEDSRNITQKDGHVPGEPPRTGPREDEARRKAQSPTDPKSMPREKQQTQQSGSQVEPGGDQSQQQSLRSEGQSQSQSQSAPSQSRAEQSGQSGLWGNDAPRMNNTDAAEKGRGSLGARDMQARPGGPLAGDQPQAIDNPAGSARPDYDQYEVNQPQNMHQQPVDEERKQREQASQQKNDNLGSGYRADGASETHDAPDASDDDSRRPNSDTDVEVQEREAEKRGYGGNGEAEKKAYDQR